MDDLAMQQVLIVLIIDHLVHQCLDAHNEIFGVLFWPGQNILEFSKVHMGVDIVCHSLLDSVEEGRSFCLGRFLFLFAAHRHPLCMHLQGFGSQGCKNILEVVLAVRCDAVQEEPVLQGMPKYGEGVVCIFQVPVVDGQADGYSSSNQCTGYDISCGLARLSDEMLWGWFCGHVSAPGFCSGMVRQWSDQENEGIGHKNGGISETIDLIDFKLGQIVGEGVPYH